jgi:hypothetical protein
MKSELYIEGHQLDITSEISALLNFAIDDIKNFSARSTTWSKTIVLPGTANNNRLFGHIFQVGQSNSYNSAQPNVGFNFNAAKAAQCILFQDQVQTFKGVLRLLQVNYYGGLQGRVEYEVSIFGTLVSLNSILSGALLEDLDFSAYNHIYNDANIVNSWDNPGGSGYYYPLIDYGTYSTDKHNWDIKTFRPGLYAKEYVDKIFAAAGKRYISPLLDTPRLKTLIIPHSKKIMTVSLTKLFSADGAATYYGTPPVTPAYVPVRFDTTSGTGFTANAGPDKIIFTFNGTVTTNVIIKYLFTGTGTSSGGLGGLGVLSVYKNGPTGTLLNGSSFDFFGAGSYTIGAGSNINVSMAPGDTIEFTITQSGPFFGTVENVTFDTSHFDITAAGGSSVAVPISIGDTVALNDNIPQNVRQIDFLVGLIKLWNLYITEDKNDENLYYITPYIDYYSKNFSNAVDWSQKLNYNKPIKSRPMSELNAKIYKFKFKQDSDYFNDLYRKRYNEGYGDRIYDSQFEFTQQTNEFEVCFSGTPLVGYGGEDKVYPTIFKRTGSDSAPVEENVDSNIRILQSKKITGVTPWSITTNAGVTVLNTLTRYGYAGHLDDPDIPTNDLNFGAPKELFFILTAGNLSNNQFNVYWSNYMREITDKDSKLVTANFYLTAKDILNLDFSKYIYVDGIAYRLNAIRDYNASKPTDCVVELLKVNSASYSESSSNEGPPAGCYLLWSDDNTLDYDDGEELLYGDCNTNPGDGGDPPVVNKLNWSWQRLTIALGGGTFKISVDNVLMVLATNNDSGVLDLQDGQEIRIEVSGAIARLKRIFVSNSIDGVVYDQTTSGTPSHVYTFTVGSDKDYTVIGSINNP